MTTYEEAVADLHALEQEFVVEFLATAPDNYKEGMKAWQERYMHAARNAAQATLTGTLEVLYEHARRDIIRIMERQGIHAGKIAALEAAVDRLCQGET